MASYETLDGIKVGDRIYRVAVDSENGIVEDSIKPVTSGSVYSALKERDEEIENTSKDIIEIKDKIAEGVPLVHHKTESEKNEEVGGIYGEMQENYGLAIGDSSNTTGSRSLAIGNNNTANGTNSFVGGDGCQTSDEGTNSFIFGEGLISSVKNQVVFGRLNSEDEDAVLIIGNGTSNDNRSNLFVIKNNGDLYINGKKVTFGGGGSLTEIIAGDTFVTSTLTETQNDIKVNIEEVTE